MIIWQEIKLLFPADYTQVGNDCDYCNNVAGIQDSLPSGYQKNGLACDLIPSGPLYIIKDTGNYNEASWPDKK